MKNEHNLTGNFIFLIKYFMETRVKNIFNNSVEFNKLSNEEKENLLQEFSIKSVEDWWQDWMNDYTEAKDWEEISERELIDIEIKQAENFLKQKFY